MIKKLWNEAPWAILRAMVLVILIGVASDLVRHARQAEPARSEVGTGTQRPYYTGPAECLTEGTGHPESCRGELPECLAEDGSGPGVLCWFTSDGLLWLIIGDDH